MSATVETIAETCDAILARLAPGGAQRSVEEVRRRLREPTTIAIAGRVSAGKSTLVNALLGLRVAPTAAGECTRVVTRFGYGEVDHARVLLRDGTERPLPLTAKRALPNDLNVDLAEVESIDVSLYSDLLERVTIVDTPGLAGLDAAARSRTEVLLLGRSREAIAQTDALVYVLSGDVRDDDRDIINQFESHCQELPGTAANALAVLTKTDKLGETAPAAQAAAERIAERAARELSLAVAAVLPVMGLVAEAAETGRIDEQRARWLAELAALPGERRARALRSSRRLLQEANLPMPGPALHDLLSRLDILGVRVCIDAVLAGRTGARALTSALREVSGISRLRSLLSDSFSQRGDRIRAHAALARLRRLQADASDRAARAVLVEELAIAAERLKLMPETRWMRANSVMQRASEGAIALPPELQEDVRRVALGRSVTEQLGVPREAAVRERRAAAVARAARWRAYANDGRRRRAEEQAAQTMTLAFSALAREVTEGAHAG